MSVEIDGQPVELSWGKPRELVADVAYVAAYGPVHVEVAAEGLWPNLALGAGRQRLRNVFLRNLFAILTTMLERNEGANVHG